ncbi:type II toxin-antitoxin system RelE/ParE family toxin [Pseudomonas gingeri]|uniref:Type II toxin-antitoxin system mRNA interferase toxin, RelE/StbE family n=1 Tax=Pseudomonas gingeri TaxID=117681 RepID=A0A7Y7YJ12_9PSED|nr:type II toxin-antitoxin system mRNA interferase toxin, RelE/StbE family [Pseudomonas gingeri]NWA02764.1 type II toxin-antitoxin system mRNA interferase toxin, RelE/StbE family [Pseudomonas gingeri]NWA18275.1 type II toxin-antitoxin system mRNA interferase toxin, RelE/StbE family [Pseudomonas gingeri]NWA58935.1 type II toxin-antitoxin system mRNA interferase toxin, RelE/StbE family [Pseudomonas gingeri]NWA99514.1 type II toxin-antitoxin system mRNA interferase toxin, RelE/StbE family [Pseudom
MLKIRITEQFALDVKTQKALGQDLDRIKPIIEGLTHQRKLPLYCCDNPIPGTWGRWNCKIGFDWWLLYKCDAMAGTITLERTGSVKDLFE